MSEHPSLPVAGYKPQSDAKVAEVNRNKELEERCLRRIEELLNFTGHGAAGRELALGKTAIQEAFMWINRAVFQPGRVRLPEDGRDGA